MTAQSLPLPRRLAGRPFLVLACVVIAAAGGAAVAVTGSSLPLVAAVAAALGALLVIRPEVGTIVFLALLWSNAPAVLVRNYGLQDAIANASIVLLLIPVAGYILSGKPLVITPALFALIAFLGANLLSAATSTNPAHAASQVTSIAVEGVLIYLVVSNAVRTPGMARAGILVIVLMSAILAGITVHQELTGAYRQTYFGFAETTLTNEPEVAVADDGRPRAMGPIGEQNRYAQILLVAVPLAYVGLRLRRPVLRALVLGSTVLVLGGIVLTYSRGAFVALALLAVLLVWQRYMKLRHMLVVVVLAVLAVPIVAPEIVERVGSIGSSTALVSSEGEDPDGAILGRTTSNIAALRVFIDHPLTGVGPGVYFVDYSQAYGNEFGLRYFETSRRAHNMYLEWGADLGIFGLGSGLAFVGITLVQLGRLRGSWRDRPSEHAALAGAFWLAIVAYLATAVFLHLSYVRYFFVLMALANSTIWILSRARDAEDRAANPESGRAASGGQLS